MILELCPLTPNHKDIEQMTVLFKLEGKAMSSRNKF